MERIDFLVVVSHGEIHIYHSHEFFVFVVVVFC